uniref:BolA-like protein n=1 Tax=Craspedostauros australis TaxID=1486917 RepID=A0A7R9ZT94_9STRA
MTFAAAFCFALCASVHRSPSIIQQQHPLPSHMFHSSVSRLARRSALLASRSMSDAVPAFPVEASIRAKLSQQFEPAYLDVINESHMHNVPANSETHFKVVVVSSQFDDIAMPVKRHRLINTALAEEMEGPVHALSIVAKTPTQWEKMIADGKAIPASPSCRGGDGSLPKK